jgi:hypothetical protein
VIAVYHAHLLARGYKLTKIRDATNKDWALGSAQFAAEIEALSDWRAVSKGQGGRKLRTSQWKLDGEVPIASRPRPSHSPRPGQTRKPQYWRAFPSIYARKQPPILRFLLFERAANAASKQAAPPNYHSRHFMHTSSLWQRGSTVRLYNPPMDFSIETGSVLETGFVLETT